jgi:hypothetical protein
MHTMINIDGNRVALLEVAEETLASTANMKPH